MIFATPPGQTGHVTHHYEFLGDRLIIGRFCAIAKGIEVVMNGANHRMNSVTTYPFNIMGGGWEKCTPMLERLGGKGVEFALFPLNIGILCRIESSCRRGHFPLYTGTTRAKTGFARVVLNRVHIQTVRPPACAPCL